MSDREHGHLGDYWGDSAFGGVADAALSTSVFLKFLESAECAFGLHVMREKSLADISASTTCQKS